MVRPLARGRRASAAALALGVVLLRPGPAPAASYPPQYHFQTVSTDRVSVHFHQGFEAMARQAASMATEILAWHEARYGQKVGRVQIVLVDADDQSNGFASPLPYPLVTIRAVAPDGTDDFGNHEGWLRLVLTHELAHTVHLEESRGLWGLGRKVFGRAPYVFPNTLAMSWMIEGLATYEETQLTAFGRGRNPDSQMLVRMAALEGRFTKEDQAIYALDAWPGGQAPYVFGEALLRRLSEQSGADTVPKMARQQAVQFPPFLDGRTARKVTGTGLHAHWTAWATQATEAAERDAAEREAQGLTSSRPVTARGIRQVSPRFSPDGTWVAYASRTLTRFPEIRLARPDGSEDHRLALRNGGSGLAWTPDGKALVYSELQVHRTFSVFGDLSLVDAASGDVRRLTRGVRAYDPDVSPDGRTIVFARKMGDRSDLFTVGLDGREPKPLTSSVEGVEWSGPRWSPRGDSIVAARLLPGGWLDLVRVDPATGAVEQLTHDRAKDVEPTWMPDGEAVVFRSDREGVSNLYALRLADREVRRVTNVLGGAFQPSVSPDGRSVAYSAYSSRGYDVVVAPLDLGAAPVAPEFLDTHPAPRPDPLPAASPVKPYRAWSMLLPRFWTPWIQLGDDEDRYGVATGGSDALFRHAWAARATYGTQSERVNASAFYLYDRFRPTFVVSAQDTTDVQADDLVRTRKVNLQASLPVRRTVRSIQALSVTWRGEREQVLGSDRPEDSIDLGGIETAWAIASPKNVPVLHLAGRRGAAAPRLAARGEGPRQRPLARQADRGRPLVPAPLRRARRARPARGGRHDVRRRAVRAVVRGGRLPGRQPLRHRPHQQRRPARLPERRVHRPALRGAQRGVPLPPLLTAAGLALVPALPPALQRVGLLRRGERLVGGVPCRGREDVGRRVARPRQRDRLRPAPDGPGHPRPRLRRAGRHEGVLPVRARVLAGHNRLVTPRSPIRVGRRGVRRPY